jgi:hypothetical protein
VAVNCCLKPAAIEGFAGVTAIETSVGAVAVRVVEAATDPETAPIVEVPCTSDVARPEAAMVATAVDEEVQVTDVVRFCVLPLE